MKITAYDKTKGVTINPVAGKFQLDASGADLKDEVQVTVIYNGVTATKTLNVVNKATVGTVTLGNVVLPKDQTMLTPKDSTNVEVTYTAKNTLGEDYTLTQNDLDSKAVQFISSDDSILNPNDISVTDEGKLKISKFGKAGNVTLTVLTPATGQTSKLDITVNEDKGAPYTIALDKSSAQFAAGSDDTIYVPFTVKDKYGNKVEPKDLNTTDITLSSDNKKVVDASDSANLHLVTTAGDDHYGQLAIKPSASAKKGDSANITVTLANGQKATLTVTASDEAVPTVIDTKKDTTVDTSLLVGATETLSFDVKDQYGTTYTNSKDGYTVEYTTSDSDVLAITSDESTKDNVNNASVDVQAKKAGTATVKAQLKKGSTVVAEKSYTINVVANDSTKVSYSIPAIDPLYKGQEITDVSTPTAKKAAVDSGYAEKVQLNATDANGNVTKVPTSAVVGNPKITLTDAAGNSDLSAKVGIFEYNGSYYLYTKVPFVAADFTKADGSKTDLTGKISFTINADDTVKVVSQNFTVSKDDAKAQSISFKNKPVGTSDASDVSTATIANKTAYTDSNGLDGGTPAFYVWVKDQFGGYQAITQDDVSYSLANVDGVTGINDDTVAPTTLAVTDVNHDTVFTKNDAKFRLIAEKDGVISYLTITANDAVAPTATVGSTHSNSKLDLNFSENVDSITIDESSINSGDTVDKTFTQGSKSGSLTIDTANGGAVDGDTITFTVKDTAGNSTQYVATFDGSTWTLQAQ